MLLPLPAAALLGGTIVEGARAFGSAPMTTPLGGALTPYLSVHAALLLAALGLSLARTQRDLAQAQP